MERKYDEQGRWRSQKVGFRLSDEEANLLNKMVSVTGLQKQDYIMKRLLSREIVVHGNARVYKALKDNMQEILEELKRIGAGGELAMDTLMLIGFIAKILEGLKGESPE